MSRIGRFAAVVGVALAARWLYDPSLECEFTFDDHLGVTNNEDVDTGRTGAKQIWRNDIVSLYD